MFFIIKGYCPLIELNRLMHQLSQKQPSLFQGLVSFKYYYYNDNDLFEYLNKTPQRTTISFVNYLNENHTDEIILIHTFNELYIEDITSSNFKKAIFEYQDGSLINK